MRKLLWFALGFGAACALCVYLLPRDAVLWVGVIAATAAIIGLLLLKSKAAKAVGLLLLGIWAGQLWFYGYDRLYLASARAVDGQTVSATVSVSDYSFDTDYGVAAEGTLQLEDKQYRMRFYLNCSVELEPGDTVSGEFRLRYTAPGGSTSTFHGGNGILLLGYAYGQCTVQENASEGLRHFSAHIRWELKRLIAQMFPEDAQPFVRALLLGDTSQLDYATETALSLSGIRHVAAVSGLHVSVLFTMLYLLCGKRRLLSLLIGLPSLLLFAAVAGFSPSVMRAAIMQGLMLLAMACKKEYDPLTALSFAALVMLTLNPLAITAVGFQLSVCSVAGIFLFGGRISGWLLDAKRFGRWKPRTLPGRLARWFSTSVAITLSAMIATMPLTAFYFGTVSLLSPLTNLLCLWVVTGLFCGIVVACLLGAIFLPLGSAVGWVLAWAVRYVLGVSGLIAGFPLAAVYTCSPYILAWLLVCYALLAVFLLSTHKRPLILGCCAVLALCVALTAAYVEPQLDHYRVTVLDVGQGQCVLLQSGGRTYMVDCGGSYDEEAADTAAAALLSQGIQRLDGLILTHYDVDHVGGAAYLLGRVPADLLVLPQGQDSAQWDPMLLAGHSGQVIRPQEAMQISWEDANISVHVPEQGETNNENSLCILFHTEKCDILITGDRSIEGELELLLDTGLPKLDALVVGHHGSASATGELLLYMTRPDFALISVGAGNRYNHPSQQVLDRLAAYGCVIRRTDLEGTIIFKG